MSNDGKLHLGGCGLITLLVVWFSIWIYAIAEYGLAGGFLVMLLGIVIWVIIGFMGVDI